MRSLTDLLRDLRDCGAHIRYYNNRGTHEGRPVIWRGRAVEVAGAHHWILAHYGNWPPDGTFEVHVWGHEITVDPVTSVEQLWEIWDRLKVYADTPDEPYAAPEPAGQLDMFDLLAVSS